ncbi:MAG: alpha/beta fold hydrolase [Pseudomonadota bacterium]|nr:alpha/beta fold hydrolase [Pseudomonadota bacterium]
MGRMTGALLVLAPLLAIGAVLAAGEILSAAAPAAIGDAPADLHATTVRIAVRDGFVAGWLVRGRPRQGAVLLMHGVRSNRLQMLPRARFLAAQGYTVLLIDLPSHGESSGSRITFGAREQEGAGAALAFLAQQCPDERIGVIGVSLGAAALVLAQPQPAPAAVVLESMYPTIGEAVANRLQMRLGAAGRWLAPILVLQLPLRAGVSAAQLRPVDDAAALRCPVLVISGAADVQTTAAETRRIHAALPGPKQLWLLDGAAHVDLHAFAPAEYEKRVGAFLAQYLGR